MPEMRDHAVVVGGSVAGLLAARVLARYFDHVTLVDRDRFPEAPVPRPGIPQGHHIHVLWSRGLELVEDLFPGFEAAMCAAGATEVRTPKDMLWLPAPGWAQRFDVNRFLTFGRSILDWTLRQRMPADIELLTGHDVTGLIPRGNGVGGVTVREHGGSGASRALEADFVVDASGRSSRTPDWLTTLGYPAPRQTRIDPLLGYASRHYATPPGFDADWKAIYLQADPPGGRRSGFLFPLGGGRWICSLTGAGGDYPPTEDDAFVEFAESLRSRVLYEAIREAEPLTPIMGFRHTANVRRHYERMPVWPERFAVLGDAACALDPVYGQGMTVAAIQATAFDEWLRGDGSTRALQQEVAWSAAGAWLIAASGDLRFAEAEGPPIRMRTRAINWYVSRVFAAATVNEQVCARLVDVIALRSQPLTLFLPPVLSRVIMNGGRSGSGAEDGPPSSDSSGRVVEITEASRSRSGRG